jgi:diaminopimelate epimerase
MIPFIKMHGAGNDFVVLDARQTRLPSLNWQKIADRHFGIGCDQIIVLENSDNASVKMRIFNADGSEVASCGNASRCVAWLMGNEKQSASDKQTIETKAGVLTALINGNQVIVDMGEPKLDWQAIPLVKSADTLHLPIEEEMLKDPVAVSMGNPHMVFFVADIKSVPIEMLGKKLECHPLFPERANVSIAQVKSRSVIELQVFERGSGLTLACGTGACATLVAAHLRGLTERIAKVQLPGGELTIEWREQDSHVYMTGHVEVSFEGQFEEEDFAG